jgi:hypothetical protein
MRVSSIGGMFKKRCNWGRMCERDIFASFRQSNWVTKNEENKIHRGLRWPPDDGYHTTTSQKLPLAMEEGE